MRCQDWISHRQREAGWYPAVEDNKEDAKEPAQGREEGGGGWGSLLRRAVVFHLDILGSPLFSAMLKEGKGALTVSASLKTEDRSREAERARARVRARAKKETEGRAPVVSDNEAEAPEDKDHERGRQQQQ
eukprot:464393-Rhodomonas_salina.1